MGDRLKHLNITKDTYFVIAHRSSVTLNLFLVISRFTINSFSLSNNSNRNAPAMQYPTTSDSKPIWDSKKLMTLRRKRQHFAHLVGLLRVGAAEGGGPPAARLKPPAPTMLAIVALLMSVGSNSPTLITV